MPSVRKSTGRAVTPVRQPEVASARQTKLEPPSISAFPLPPGLTIHAEEPLRRLPARLEGQPPLAVGVGRFPSTRIESVALLHPAPDPFPDAVEPFPGPEPIGVNWLTSAPAAPAAASDRDLLDALRPRLAPGVLDPEALTPALPSPLRPDQRETIRRLLAEGEALLIADPGCGMETASVLALRELFRLGTIRRALLVAPNEMLRAWQDLFRAWAEELRFQTLDDPAQAATGLWPAAVHLLGSPPETVVAILRRSVGAASALAGDVLIVASYVALRRRGFDPTSLAALRPRRRWVVAGGPFPEAEDWRVLHRALYPDWTGPAALAEIQGRLERQTLRLTKAQLPPGLPRRSRIELWVALDAEQRLAYQQAVEEERTRLQRLGGAVNRSHIQAAVARLKRILAFRPGSLDGAKVRALVDLTEEILASGSKLVVVAPPEAEILDGLATVLEAHGATRLDSQAPAQDQSRVIDEFRRLPDRRVLIADSEARGDGDPLREATYVVHFSHDWNPAHRRRVEQRLFPDLGPAPPLTLYELWVADTIEEHYHRLLAAQGLLARDVALETRPKDIEERLTLQEWVREVFQVGSIEVRLAPGTGQLPGTGDLRRAWASFDADGLAAAAEGLMRALGFTQVERIKPADETGCDFAAWLTSPAGADQVFVRCVRQDLAIDVEDGQAVLDEVRDRPGFAGGYLIATADFTLACRRLAEGSEGRLALVDGAEFFRHLRVLGVVR